VIEGVAEVAFGHDDQFRPPSLNGRYRLGEATFARASGNDEVAPLTVIQKSQPRAPSQPAAIIAAIFIAVARQSPRSR
jgi:hypothetical protein